MLRRTLLLTVALLIAMAAPAAAQYGDTSSLSADDSTVVARQLLGVTGTGFQAGETAEISFMGEVRETATVGADGQFSADFRIPAGTPLGDQQVAATSPSTSATTVVEVMAGSASGAAAADDASDGADDDEGGALAFTGSSTMTLVQVGAALLAVGGLVLLFTRKRQQGEQGTTPA